MERKLVESEMVLLDFLMDHGGFSTRTRARTAIKAGLVTVDGTMIRIPSTMVAAGVTITWTSLSKAVKPKDFDLGGAAKSLHKDPKTMPAPYDIVHEDEHFDCLCQACRNGLRIAKTTGEDELYPNAGMDV